MTVKESSEKTGIKYATPLARAKNGQAGESLLRPAKKMRSLGLEYNGVIYTPSSLSKKFGMSLQTLLHRIDKLKMTVEQAVEWKIGRISTMQKLSETK